MVAVTVQLHAGLDLTHLAVNTDVNVSLAAYALKQFLVVTLTVTHQRCKHIDTLAVIVADYALHYLLLGELDHFLTTQVGIRLTCPCKQKSQIVINLSDCSYS